MAEPAERQATDENRDGKWLLLATLKEHDPFSPPPFAAVSFDLSPHWAG
jgi:hypothetical protein